ncbi:zinc-binding dehydrogenase [Streptomyces sp. NBC_00582]|uniref:zinc-binding dehydrogenase n=1 Tax=Streptomyces sp. NBC_00582 TaxID=2975783 RepID=UPI002E81C52B|nr:zinc-binding dehydrogenase [Streptomyces sp. NBC_00582]
MVGAALTRPAHRQDLRTLRTAPAHLRGRGRGTVEGHRTRDHLHPAHPGSVPGLTAGDRPPRGLADGYAENLDGRNAHLVHGVEEALGLPPRDFCDYARLAAGGRLPVRGDRGFPLADAARAHELIESGHARGKVLPRP